MACHGFTPSFAFVGEPETNSVVEPETNSVVERFNRTLEEQIIHGKTYRDRAELAAAVAAFVLTYNETRSRGYGASSMKVALYSRVSTQAIREATLSGLKAARGVKLGRPSTVMPVDYKERVATWRVDTGGNGYRKLADILGLKNPAFRVARDLASAHESAH